MDRALAPQPYKASRQSTKMIAGKSYRSLNESAMGSLDKLRQFGTDVWVFFILNTFCHSTIISVIIEQYSFPLWTKPLKTVQFYSEQNLVVRFLRQNVVKQERLPLSLDSGKRKRAGVTLLNKSQPFIMDCRCESVCVCLCVFLSH